MSIAKAALDGIWNQIASQCQGKTLLGPTERSEFMLEEVRSDSVTISLSNSTLKLEKEAFEGTLSYLLSHRHDDASPCEIRSNKVYELAGPLCQAARKGPGSQMNITYVLPILKKMGLVDIDPSIPSTAWFIA